MKKLKLDDYVKCVVEKNGNASEPKYGFVTDLNITATYPYNVKFCGRDSGFYNADELTVIINNDILDTFINDMVLI